MNLTSKRLEGRFVRLEPLEDAHREPLRTLADDADIWRFVPYWGYGANYDSMFDMRLARVAEGQWVHFSVRQHTDDRLVGQTGYMAIDSHNARVEIGATWYGKAFQGGPINPNCKLLLLDHAFACGARRVEFKTDARNAHSRAAILKLGAKEEGTLRRHLLMPDGFVRDSVYFSILDSEWPEVRSRLEGRLNAFG